MYPEIYGKLGHLGNLDVFFWGTKHCITHILLEKNDSVKMSVQ
jgi:hypothetical protein